MKARITELGVPAVLAAGLVLMMARQLPAQIVVRIAAGDNHSLFVKSDSSLWGMGYNGYGQLGIGSAPSQTNVPQQIVSGGVGTISAGAIHSLFTLGNTLWAMGDNETGELGDGTTNTQYFPEKVFTTGSRFNFVGPIAAGSLYSLFGTYSTLIAQSGLWAMGGNWVGQLGDGTTNDHYSAEELRSSLSAYGVLAVAGGDYHSLYVGPGGSLWATGDNYFGNLGDGKTMTSTDAWEMIVSSGVTAVAAGNRHSLFVESDGSLWGMGDNEYGQLGDGTTTARSTPERILPNGVIAVAAGHGHSLFLKSDGSLWGTGENGFGQLGDGTYTSRPTPVEIVPPPRPVITGISVAGTSVVVAWSTNQGGFTLQASSSLVPPVTWSNISTGVLAGNQYVVTNPISGPKMFYRLAE